MLSLGVLHTYPGYAIYGSHSAPFRLNTYDEGEDGNWDWRFVDTMCTLTCKP